MINEISKGKCSEHSGIKRMGFTGSVEFDEPETKENGYAVGSSLDDSVGDGDCDHKGNKGKGFFCIVLK